jgi:ATP-dependent exoDNAse (exonuclease V) beta subunit
MSPRDGASPGLGDELVVAGAGTGKTRALVERVLLILRRGLADGTGGREVVGSLMAITFTRAAANELQRRIEQAVRGERGQTEDGRALAFWKDVLDALPSARIGTIHGACARLLREHPQRALRLGVPLGFDILEEADAATLREESWEATRRRLFRSRGEAWEAYLELASTYGPEAVGGLVLDRMTRSFELTPEDLLAQADRERQSGSPLDSGHPGRLRALGLLVRETQTTFREAERSRSVLNFDDLETYALALLRDEEAGGRIRAAIRHLLVDEFQDTSLRQLELVLALRGSDPAGDRSLFAVGDPHQSIYGFRGAVGTLREVGRRLPGARRTTLTETHRFAHPLLTRVNAGFSVLFADAEVPYAPVTAPGLPYRTEVEFRFIPKQPQARSEGPEAPAPDGTPGTGGLDPTSPGVLLRPSPGDDREAQVVADWIEARLRQGGTVPPWRAEDGKDPHPIGPGDVAILLSARTHQGLFLRELRRRGIPAVPGQSRGFLRRQEVLDVLNLVSTLVAPEDAPALYAVLRSPYFAFSDGEIAGWFAQAPAGSALRNAFESAARQDTTVSAAWHLLEELRLRSGELPPAALLREALDRVGAWASLTQDERGGLALANVEKLLDRIRELTREGVATLEGVREKLLEWMRSGEDEGEAEVELSHDSVNVLSVHGAKGLQFPVVVLPQAHRQWKARSDRLLVSPSGRGVQFRLPAGDRDGPSRSGGGQDPLEEELHAAEQAEAERLLYVGMTRAMVHLLVTGVDDPCGAARTHQLRRWHQALRRLLPAMGMEVSAATPPGPPEAGAPPRPWSHSPTPVHSPPPTLAGPTPWTPTEVSWTVSEVEAFRRCPRAFFLLQEGLQGRTRSREEGPLDGAEPPGGVARELGIRFHERIRGAGVGAALPEGAPDPVDAWVALTRAEEGQLPGPVVREEEVLVVTEHGSVRGRWDAYFPSLKPPRLVDYKTGAFPTDPDDARERFGFQLSCYALALPAPMEVGVFHPPDGRGHFWTLTPEELARFRQELSDTLGGMRRVLGSSGPPPECADPGCGCRTMTGPASSPGPEPRP